MAQSPQECRAYSCVGGLPVPSPSALTVTCGSVVNLQHFLKLRIDGTPVRDPLRPAAPLAASLSLGVAPISAQEWCLMTAPMTVARKDAQAGFDLNLVASAPVCNLAGGTVPALVNSGISGRSVH